MANDKPIKRPKPKIFWLLSIIFVFAPLFRAAQGGIPLLLLQLLAVLTLVFAFWTPTDSRPMTKSEVTALVLLLIYPLLFIIPLPGLSLDSLPGRDKYAEVLGLIGQDYLSQAPTLSLYPLETESAWFTLLIPIAVFVATRKLGYPYLNQLILLVIGVACFQSFLGLMQFGQDESSILYWGLTYTHFGSGIGTYTNHNHLAGLIEMTLPLTFALFFYSFGRNRRRRRSKNWQQNFLLFSTFRGRMTLVYGALALLLVLGVIFTRSRSGIALIIIAILAVTFIYGRRIGGDNVYGPIGTIVTFVAGSGIAIGLAPVLDRFVSLSVMEDYRWMFFSNTIDGIFDFFPIGSGPGTYPDIFHAFQPIESGKFFVNHAHNDYLEWLFEGGVLALLLIVLLLSLYSTQWRKVWTKNTWSRFQFLQVGAGLGISLLLLHELVEYNLFIPANQVYFAFLAGVFFSDHRDHRNPKEKEREKRKSGRKRQTPDLVPTAASGDSGSPALQPAVPEPTENPFSKQVTTG